MRLTAYAILIIVGLALILMPMSVPRFKSDAPYSVLNTGPTGTSSFGALLYHSGKVVPVLFPYGSNFQGNSTLVIVQPNLDFSKTEVDILRSFLENGGTVLLIGTSPQVNSLLKSLGLKERVSKEPVITITFKNGRPITREIEGTLSQGVMYLVLGNPHAILNAKNPLVKTSNASMLGKTYGSFSIVDNISFGRGRIILISDPDIVTNSLFKLNEPFLRNLVAVLPKTFYIDEAHHADLNPYSAGTIVIHRAVNKKLAFYYILFVAVLAFFIESGLAMKVLNWLAGLIFALLVKLFGGDGESLDEVIKRLEDEGLDGDKLKTLLRELETGSRLGDMYGRWRIHRKAEG
ncbi:DUF4350 domain-containing protein [Thermococcus sp.]